MTMRWQNKLGRTAAVIALAAAVLIVAGVAGGFFFLQSDRFQRLAIQTITQDADEATGARTKIGKLDVHLSTLTANLYDITVRGGEPTTEPPLLHVDKLTVGIKIQSILQRKFSLTELVIEHPAVRLAVDGSGRNNLPQTPARKGANSTTSLFDLAVQHVVLSNGEALYNDKTIPLEANLYDFRNEIRFDSAATRYDGSIAYGSGSIRYDNDPAFPHSLDARFSATPRQLTIDSAVLHLGASALSINARLTDYSNPVFDGRYDLRFDTRDAAALSPLVAPSGVVALSGTLHYQAVDGRSFLQCIASDGHIASTQLSASSSQGHVDLRGIQGLYQLAEGRFQAHDLRFETLGGEISTSVDVQHLDAKPDGKFEATLRNISLEAAHRTLRRADLKRFALSSRLGGTVVASWTGGFKNLLARTDLTLRSSATGNVVSAPNISTKIVPLDGQIHAAYNNRRNSLTFRDTALRIPQATVALQGQMSDHSDLQVKSTTGDLHQVADLLSALGIEQAASFDLAGSASINVAARGSIRDPQISGNFTASDLRVQGSQWRSVSAGFQASPSRFELKNASLINAHQGKATLNANVALRNWSYLPSGAIAATVSVQQMSIADLQRLANRHYPLSGELSADISIRGSQLNPQGSGSAKIEHAQAYDQAIQQLTANFSADKSTLNSSLNITLPAGAANGTLSYTPATRAYVVKLNAPSIVLQKLQAVQVKNLGIAGTLNLSVSGEGTIDNPQLEATVESSQLQLREQSLSQIKAQVHVANRQAAFTLDASVAQTALHSHANVALTGDYELDAAIDTGGISIAPLLALYLPSAPQGLQGETELHATLKGPLKDASRIEAHVTIPTLKASYQSLEIAAGGPIRADYQNSTITLQPTQIRGTDTSLDLQGTLPLAGGASVSLSAKGSVDVRIAKIFVPGVQSSGSIALDVHASGTATNPKVDGQVHIKNVAVSSPGAPLGVEELNGNLAIGNNSLQLSSLTGKVGGGTISAGGSISYRPDLQFNISLVSKSVRLRYPDGLRALLDGNLIWSGTKEESTLSGRVLIDALSFTSDFDLSKFSGQFGGSAVPSSPGIADTIKLAVGVQSKSNLNATSSQVSIEGDVNLQAVGTAANPVIVGRTDLTSGELFYRNVRYELQRGVITFDNPNQTEPVLNVSATTTVEQYSLTLTLRGPFDKLTTTYTSDPPLATADVINLIANGQTTSEQSAAGTSTDSILASQVAGQVTGGIQHLAGVSSLQIDPLIGGTSNPSAKVALQQRVSKNFLFTFSTDLSQPGTEIVQGDYQINERWSVSVTRDEVGGISVDGKYHTRF